MLVGAICALVVSAAVVIYSTRGDPASLTAPIAAQPVPAVAAPAPAPAPAPTVADPELAPVHAAPPAPVPAARPPAVAADPPVAGEPAPAPPEPRTPPAPPDGRGPGKRPARNLVRGVGSITPPGARILPERTIEVHRGSRDADHPRTGDHTPSGAPLEDTVDIDTKTTHGGGAHRATSPPRKDAGSP